MTRLRATLAVGAAVLITAVAFIPRQSAHETSVAATPVVRTDSLKTTPTSEPSTPRPVSSTAKLSILPLSGEPPHPAGSPAYQEWLDSRISELEALAWLEDAGSLQKILAEIRSPVPEIRATAIDATREFGSRDAVPYLRSIADETRDPAESKLLAELIDYLELPTMVEQSDRDRSE